MAKLEVTKTIEARMLNKRTRQTLSQPPVTIPYGAILDDITENRDLIEFTYVGELYSCKLEVLRAATHALDGSGASLSSGSSSVTSEPTIAPTFVWEKLNSNSPATSRAKLPGGWLISAGASITFYPDPTHLWDGKTID